ncbi:hypothetical protein MMC28_010200 [Mycoblastus sanguinarius]|nr:hypothetical protein [Mycoblastus sanguinarius]
MLTPSITPPWDDESYWTLLSHFFSSFFEVLKALGFWGLLSLSFAVSLALLALAIFVLSLQCVGIYYCIWGADNEGAASKRDSEQQAGRDLEANNTNCPLVIRDDDDDVVEAEQQHSLFSTAEAAQSDHSAGNDVVVRSGSESVVESGGIVTPGTEAEEAQQQSLSSTTKTPQRDHTAEQAEIVHSRSESSVVENGERKIVPPGRDGNEDDSDGDGEGVSVKSTDYEDLERDDPLHRKKVEKNHSIE